MKKKRRRNHPNWSNLFPVLQFNNDILYRNKHVEAVARRRSRTESMHESEAEEDGALIEAVYLLLSKIFIILGRTINW